MAWAFSRLSRSNHSLLTASAILTFTATIVYAKPTVEAEGPPTKKPTFGSFGFRTLKLDQVDQINHDTKRFRFALPEGENSVSGLKLTSALLTLSWPKGDWTPVMRPYTPVSALDDPGHVDLVIKHYPQGRQSSHIHSLKAGDSLTFLGLALPGYKWSPNKHSHVLLIAGGAGITPIYQLAKGIINNPQEKTKITLVWGTNTDKDVFFRAEFDDLAKRFPERFSVYYTVSRPVQGSEYREGRVTKELLQEVMKKEGFDPLNGGMVFLCGPPAMEDALSGKKNGVLQSLGIEKDRFYKF